MTRWKLVPVEATGEQALRGTMALSDAGVCDVDMSDALAAYTAMLSAAPAPDDAVARASAAIASVLSSFDSDDRACELTPGEHADIARAAIAALLGEEG